MIFIDISIKHNKGATDLVHSKKPRNLRLSQMGYVFPRFIGNNIVAK
jgi:hypothetical protein